MTSIVASDETSVKSTLDSRWCFQFFHFVLSFENNRRRWFVGFSLEDLANDCLRYGILGDVYGRGGPVDFLTTNVVQPLDRGQSVVGHFQW